VPSRLALIVFGTVAAVAVVRAVVLLRRSAPARRKAAEPRCGTLNRSQRHLAHPAAG
jgi:hypothetical protein